MFELVETGVLILQVIAGISLTIAIIALPVLVYFKSKNTLSRLLLIGSFLLLGGLVYTLIIKLTPSGQTLMSDAMEYKSTLRLIIVSLGNISICLSVIIFLVGMWHFINTSLPGKVDNFPTNNKTIKQLSVALLAVLVLGGVGYSSFHFGIQSAPTLDSISLMTVLQLQNECIRNGKDDCIGKTNDFALDLLATHLEALKEIGQSEKSIEAINSYITWNDSRKTSDEKIKASGK